MEPSKPPTAPPASPPCSSTNDRILYALRTSLRELDWALVQSTRTWRTPLACTIILVVYLACALLAHRGDMRTLYTRAPPRWWLASPVRFPLVKELLLYLRIYTSVLRVWYVAPGYTVYTRLQMLHCLATNLVTNAAGVLLFLGSDQCTKEQTLLAGFASAIASSILTLASRLTFKWAYQRGELAAALHEHKIERYHRQMYRYVEEAINGGANESFDGASWWRGVKRRLRRRGRGQPRAAAPCAASARQIAALDAIVIDGAVDDDAPPAGPSAAVLAACARGSPRVSPVVDRRSKNSRDSRLSRGSKSSSGSGAKPALVPRSSGCLHCDDLGSSIGGASASAGGGSTRERPPKPPPHLRSIESGQLMELASPPTSDELPRAPTAITPLGSLKLELACPLPVEKVVSAGTEPSLTESSATRRSSACAGAEASGCSASTEGSGGSGFFARVSTRLSRKSEAGGSMKVPAFGLSRSLENLNWIPRGPRPSIEEAPKGFGASRNGAGIIIAAPPPILIGGAERPSDSATPRRGSGRRSGPLSAPGKLRRLWRTPTQHGGGRTSKGELRTVLLLPEQLHLPQKGFDLGFTMLLPPLSTTSTSSGGIPKSGGGGAAVAFVPVVHVAAAPSQERVKFANRPCAAAAQRMVRATYVAADLPRGVSADGVRYSQTLTAAQRDEHALANRDANSPQKGRRIPFASPAKRRLRRLLWRAMDKGKQRGPWPPLAASQLCHFSWRLALVWTLNLALLIAALVLLLQLVLQGSSAGEAERLALEYEAGSGDVPWGWNSWSRTAWEAWGVSLVHTLILQDGAKVALVALVSPLVLPSLLPPERQSWRARVLRLFVRMFFNALEVIA